MTLQPHFDLLQTTAKMAEEKAKKTYSKVIDIHYSEEYMDVIFSIKLNNFFRN